jgi:hypothetical protein
MEVNRNMDADGGYEEQSPGDLSMYTKEEDSNHISRCDGTKIWRDEILGGHLQISTQK